MFCMFLWKYHLRNFLVGEFLAPTLRNSREHLTTRIVNLSYISFLIKLLLSLQQKIIHTDHKL